MEPPGECAHVASQRTVVLAPHYDDEVLGCGGLVARLARDGARVHVLFLSDGAGGGEAVDDPAAYAVRRRAESERAVAALGGGSCEHLGLPDGSLASCLGPLAAAIERVLLAQRPDLLLVTSPLEITPDHRAAFAALHRVLARVREGDPLHALAVPLRILAYEVNHPAHPDLLIDVSTQAETLAAAMACYPSQQERHDYLAAALGLRRWRCLTLGPGVELAEGYRSLGLDDFRTRSPASLIAALGGVPELHLEQEGPLVSVVVRTRDRPALLEQALRSLAASTYRRIELVLVNDGGASPLPPADFPFPLLRVDHDQSRGRTAAANAGVTAARGDFVLFLDDDDLFAPEHVATLVGLARGTSARVAYVDAAVVVYETAAQGGYREHSRSLPYSRDFDPDLLLLDNYIPFHTVLVERELYREAGAFDPSLDIFEDWDLLIRLSRLVPFVHLRVATCEYRHFRGATHALGESPESRPDFVAAKRRVLDKHRDLLSAGALARAVIALRRESVELAQAAASARTRAVELERSYHRTNGELAAVREESRRRGDALREHEAEFQRRFDEEATLRRGIEEQLQHLGRTYAEIERLGALAGAAAADRDRALALIARMESTRAWRLHRWWERTRGRLGAQRS